MFKKLFIQIILLFFVISLLIIFYNKYFSSNEISQLESQNNEVLSKKQSNLIENIRYLSKDVNDNIYLIEAESGISNKQNSDLITLKNVKAVITFDLNKKIYITADSAIYNNSNYDTEFFDNVRLKYEIHRLKCEKIFAKFSENFAIVSDNVIYNNNLTKLKADKIEIDLVKRTTKISMIDDKKKVKLTHNYNGFN